MVPSQFQYRYLDIVSGIGFWYLDNFGGAMGFRWVYVINDGVKSL